MHRVLVVDDSATVRRVVRRTLSQAGYEAVVAPDGRAGLEAARQTAPDLVLVDFVMPQMNGLKLVQALREVTGLARVPVVLMSAKADKIGQGFLAQTGAVHAIRKPFSPDALLTVLAQVLARSRDADEPPPTEDDVEALPEVAAAPTTMAPLSTPQVVEEAAAVASSHP